MKKIAGFSIGLIMSLTALSPTFVPGQKPNAALEGKPATFKRLAPLSSQLIPSAVTGGSAVNLLSLNNQSEALPPMPELSIPQYVRDQLMVSLGV